MSPVPVTSGAGLPGGGELRRAAQELEAVFLRMLLELSLPQDGGGLFGEGPAAGVVRSMFVDQVGQSLAGQRALGIADLVERDLARRSVSRDEGPQALRERGAPVDVRG